MIDKPAGITSYDVIRKLKKITGIKKIGHAGTLDPFATGLLIVGIGRAATKNLDQFKLLPKTYRAVIRLGMVSDTHDSTGKLNEKTPADKLNIKKEQIKQILKKFIGHYEQTPPMYSAKKIKGEKLYNLARQGITIERNPIMLEIYDVKLNRYSPPLLDITVSCSAGTYIRVLAHDIGKKLGVGGLCAELRRTKIGQFKVGKTFKPNEITAENINRVIHSNINFASLKIKIDKSK